MGLTNLAPLLDGGETSWELLCASVSSPEYKLRSAHFMGLAGGLTETILVKHMAHLGSFKAVQTFGQILKFFGARERVLFFFL